MEIQMLWLIWGIYLKKKKKLIYKYIYIYICIFMYK